MASDFYVLLAAALRLVASKEVLMKYHLKGLRVILLSLVLILLPAPTFGAGVPPRGRISAKSIEDFYSLPGSLNLSCYGSAVVRLSAKTPKIGVRFTRLNPKSEINARKRQLRLLNSVKPKTTLSKRRAARLQSELSQFSQACTICGSLRIRCRGGACRSSSPSSTSSSSNSSLSSSSSSSSAPPASCTAATAAWQTQALSPQFGTFTLEYDATPLDTGMDGIVALSNGPGTVYADFAVLVRFANGLIQARNGADYGADAPMGYLPNTSYHFRLVVSVPNHSYSVYVTPKGLAEQLLATEFAFRDEQAAITQINIAGVQRDRKSVV